jgi:CDP-diacylglycerol--glycerol-3-phosphate 3-phosphatidyltransferase
MTRRARRQGQEITAASEPSRRKAYALAGMTTGRVGGPGKGHRSHIDAPRVRDVPAPRRSESAIGPLFRSVFKWPYRAALAGLYRLGLKPWQLTALSLLANAVIGWLLVTGHFFVAGLLLMVAGLLDIFDGGLARLRGEASRAGAFLDSVVDRVSDLILFGALFWALAGQGHRLAAAFALSSLIVSMLVSHIRAEGEAIGLSLSEGVFQRLERYVMLLIGLTTPGALLPVVVILTILGGLTVIQRAASGWRQLR